MLRTGFISLGRQALHIPKGNIRSISKRTFATSEQEASTDNNDGQPKEPEKEAASELATTAETTPKKVKTVAELDEELRRKMSGLSGEGGEAGVEYENGEPTAMKRSVKNNMFRYI